MKPSLSHNVANIFDTVPNHLPTELVDVITDTGQVKIERIVSRGHTTPEDFWYDQDKNEFVLVLEGSATLTFLDPEEHIRMLSGDYLIIPAHRKHRVTSTAQESDTIWLTVYF